MPVAFRRKIIQHTSIWPCQCCRSGPCQDRLSQTKDTTWPSRTRVSEWVLLIRRWLLLCPKNAISFWRVLRFFTCLLLSIASFVPMTMPHTWISLKCCLFWLMVALWLKKKSWICFGGSKMSQQRPTTHSTSHTEIRCLWCSYVVKSMENQAAGTNHSNDLRVYSEKIS